MKTTQLNEKQIAQWSQNWNAQGERLGLLVKETVAPINEPEYETAKCSRCPAVLTYPLQPGCSELESFMGACDSEDWVTRNTVDGIRLLCASCAEKDQFYRDENLGR